MSKHTLPPSGPASAGELSVVSWPIERPIPYARNARVIPKSAIDKVATSIRQFGMRQPIVVDENDVVLVGHVRLLALRQLGLTHVPVHVAVGLSPEKARAYRLMDNRSHDETTWDYGLLAPELADLGGLGLDLDLTGFGEAEIATLLSGPSAGLTDPDELPEPPAEPITQPGDLWIMDDHRLACGDSIDPVQVERVMDGQRASLMATDPPYLCNYDGGNRPQTWGKDGQPISGEDKTKHWDTYVDHDTSVKFYEDFLKVALAEALTETPVVYQWFAMMKADIVFEAWRTVGLLPHQVIVWHKSRHVLSRCDFMWNYEVAAYGWVQGKRPEPERRPPANATAVWEVPSAIEDGASGIHPTQKAVELIRRPIEYHTHAGELIYEPFAGSGTAFIAAAQMGRRCFGLEISPSFVDLAVIRWQNFTGRTAQRVGG